MWKEGAEAVKERGSVTTVSLQLPEAVPTMLRRHPDEIVRILRLAAARHWFERGVISQDKAAEIAGLESSQFVAILDSRSL
jgi:hypothetical protein